MNRSSQLLDDLTKKKITLDGLRLECARWAADEVNACQFKPFPVMPKQMETDTILPEDRLSPMFSSPEVTNYINLKNRIFWENKYLKEWLLECRGLLLKHDEIERVARIDGKLKEGGE